MCAAAPVRKELMENRQPTSAMRTSGRVLLALIFALPLMNPPILAQVVATDLLFLLLLVVVAVEVLTRQRKLRWLPGFSALLASALSALEQSFGSQSAAPDR
jgi:hypothetical protein